MARFFRPLPLSVRSTMLQNRTKRVVDEQVLEERKKRLVEMCRKQVAATESGRKWLNSSKESKETA